MMESLRSTVYIWMCALIACSLWTSSASAQTASGGDGFERIAVRSIDLSAGRAAVRLPGRPQSFAGLRLEVRGGSVELTNLLIQYTDGTQQDVLEQPVTVRPGRDFTSSRLQRTKQIRAVVLGFRRSTGRLTAVLYGTTRRSRPVVGAFRGPPAGVQPSDRQQDIIRRRLQEQERESGVRRFAAPPTNQGQLSVPGRSAVPAPRREAPPIAVPSAPPAAGAAPTVRPSAPANEPSNPTRRLVQPRDQQPRPAVPGAPVSRGFSQAVPRSAAPSATAPASGVPAAEGEPPAVDRPARDRTVVGLSEQGDTADLECVVQDTCTPVRVFFGTNRTIDKPEPELEFGGRNAFELKLGKAIVTVPRGTDRAVGQLSTPSWVDIWIRQVPPEGDPNRHFVIVRRGMKLFASKDDFLAEVRQHMAQTAFDDHAFVFVHGYRVSFDDALKRTAQLAYDLGTPNILTVSQDPTASRAGHAPFGTAFLYSWPSQARVLGYASDIEAARSSVEHLERFLKIVIEETGAKRVHLIAHSMGNVALLRALKEYVDDSGAATGAKVEQLILAAPDMAPGEFAALANQIRPMAQGVTLYASANDGALQISRNVHDQPRVGDVVNGVPTVVLNGIDTIDISAITTCYFCWGHDEYVEQPVLLNDIAALLRNGTRPPPTSGRGPCSPSNPIPSSGDISSRRRVTFCSGGSLEGKVVRRIEGLKMLRIYGRANSINVRKVLWACEEIGIPYERDDWGRGYRPTSEPEFQAVSPFGVVPVIDDDGFILRDSQAIVRYLCAKHNRADLLPTDLKRRALIEAWMDWAAIDLYNEIRPVVHGLVFKTPGADDPETIQKGIDGWAVQMRRLEGELAAGGPYLMGNEFTAADIPMGLSVNRWFALDFGKPSLPAVGAYYERLKERPAYRAHGANGLP